MNVNQNIAQYLEQFIQTYTNTPVSSGIVAEVREKVIMEFPEDMEGDPTMWGAHGLVDLPEDGFPSVKVHIF